MHRGAIAASRTESQFAAVIAHEIAHIAERHAADQLTKRLIGEGLLGLLGAVLGNDTGARAAQIGARLVAGGVFLKFSRDDEREADRVGAEIMHRAGWSARGAIEFMQLLRERQGRDPGSVEIFLSTHPSPAGRIELLERTVRRLPGGRRDSDRFQQIRHRLDRLSPPASAPR